MTVTIHRRPPRLPAPEYPAGEVVLQSPPQIPVPTGRRWAQLMMMLPMLAGAGAMALMFSAGRGGPVMYAAGGLFGVSTLGMIAVQMTMSGGTNKVQMVADRRMFMGHLAQRRRAVRRTIARQRAAQYHHHPDPDALWSVAASPRLWERRPGDPDFATARIGLGPAELATPVVPPETAPIEDLDPMCAAGLRRFLVTYAVVPDLPVVMALDGFSQVYVRGAAVGMRALARALICQAATFHAPDDLLAAFCVANPVRREWEWVKWLPHALHPTRTDALGPQRLVSSGITGLEAMLEDVLSGRPRFAERPAQPGTGATPHLLVVVDGGETSGSDHLLADDGLGGVTVIRLGAVPPRTPDRHTLILDVDADGALRTTTSDGTAAAGRADAMRAEVAVAFAQQIAPLRLGTGAGRAARRMTTDLGLAALLDLGDPEAFDPARTWGVRPNRERLRVPFGADPDGTSVDLDLKEAAQGGMGPHGLLIGATGSGKSELLRTLVLGLAATHDPALLNFVLIDFKGGATFTRLDVLPHTSAVITNLVDELPLVDRMAQALTGELNRRQELLRAAGNFASARDYERARAGGAALAPLPSLLIVCDEFSELLSAKPDFIDIFVQIGRVGRSLGIHLLLASQRLEEGRLRGLDTHLSYRIGLRTFSAVESRVVLGDPAAFELPRFPGHGYLRFSTEPLKRFRAAYVSGTHRRPVDGARPGAGPGRVPRVLPYTTHFTAAPAERSVPPEPAARDAPDGMDEAPDGETPLDILTERMRGRGVPAHQVWLPPLTDPVTLDALLPAVRPVPGRGLATADAELHGRLRAPVGLLDQPLLQRRDPLWVDLAGGSGHLAVVGGPQSGKSTLLRTLVTSLALSNTPAEAQFYCLDFGGGGLGGLRELPQVGGVASRLDTGQVRRTVAELGQLLVGRERTFAAEGVDSMATYRQLKAAGRFPADPFGDVFLVVDGWGTIRADFEELEASLTDIGNRGLSYGVHVVAAAARWMDFRPSVRDLFGTRLELRLGEPSDSVLDRRTAINVPEKMPGRGITADRLHFLTALPRVDGRRDAATLSSGAAELVRAVREAWAGPPAPPVRLLPAALPYADLPREAAVPGLPVGIAETDLGPVTIDFDSHPHFVVYGDSGSGKTAFLRALARSIMDRHTSGEVRLMVIDNRRTLLGVVDQDYLIGYGTSAAVTRAMIDEVVEVMRERLPPADVTAQQLRDRDWWRGPTLYVLVDDYDLVAATGGQPSPLLPLVEFLGQAGDIGLRLVVARRAGGSARAAFEPVMLGLRELSAPGLVMSGSRDEGPLLGGVRPAALPPGRGWLVDRKYGNRLVQLAWLPPAG
jgi:S-DNA-T family DNA segregation ATPase FtsK/SpoIIIE